MIKKLLILMFFLGGIGLASAQPWLKNLPDIGTSKNYSLYEYKTAFDKYWAPYDVKHGSYFENGKKMKAIGWKQFQRWYYSMENQVDRSTGHLPVISALDVMANYRKLKSAQAIQADWKSLGPDITAGGYAGLGRINCIAFHPTDMNTYWVGAASGGLWVTRDNGVTWTCQTDNNGVLAVSNIIIPSNFSTSNTVYISTGDRDGWDNRSIGVLKSTDGGQTWNKTGLSYTLQDGAMVNRLIVNPTDENTLIAATSLGVFKTTDGGTTWSTKLANNNFIDFEFKPGDFSTFYGSTQNGTIYVSRDGGTTWNEIFNESDGSRIEMAVTAHDATYLYALVSDGSGGFYKMLKSTDAGANFTAVLDFNEINLLGWEGDGTDAGGQGWYDLALEASPTNKNIVLVGGVNSWRTLDGGTTWEILTHWYGQNGVQAVHADKHAIEYRSNGDVFECNDGGVYLSTSDGANYESKCSGLVISQMYKLGVSATDPDEIIAGLQDNGTKLKSGSAWYDVKGGDGMECIIDFTDNNIQYGTYTNGQISRTLDHWQSETEIQPADAGDGAWVTPYIMSPDDNATLYAGYADIWKTTDRGDSWTKITDLSSSYRFRSMAISLSNTKVLYVADLSNIYRTTDDGANWINITNNLPTGSNSITYIAIKHDDENTAWVTLGGYNDDKVYETTDGGATWTNISAGLPEIPAYSIVQNKQVTGEVHLYVGTEVGVYFKKGSSDWVMYSDGLPNVRIGELEIFYSSNAESSMLRAASYGRGMWESNVYYESGPMEFSAVTVKHPNTNAIAPGATDEDILLVQVAMTGSENPLSITSLVFNTQGTTDVSDITLASLYTTGTSLNADNAVLLGTIANPNGAMEFTVDRELAGGTNNFWLLYNIAQEATLNNVVDAECLSVTVGGTVRNPDIMAPDGNREINIIYCEAGASDEYEFISNVALGDIGNVSNFSTNGYGDYTAMSTDLTIGETYECIVDVSNAYASDELLAWVDWNKDGDFDDEGEQVLSSGAVGLSNYTFNIVVPSDAKLGNTRLRLRLNDTGSTPNSLPCGNSGYGEVEDYTINVTQNIFDPINGLVAYYPFNGNANDESGNGNNGTVQAAALANDRHGNSNAAYYFNGIDNYIEILNSGNLLNNTNFSLSAWIKPDNLLYSFNPIITKHQLDDNSWLFRANPEGAEIHLGFETFQPTLRYSDNVNLPNGAWRHVAIVKNGENYTFFVNGAPTSTFTDAKEFSTNANIMIGGQANFAEFFKGAIDEVRMYNIPLTSSEIQNIYNSEKPASNLVAYFPFNGNTNDESGNEHNGAINGNVVLTTDWNGAENTAYDFSGEIGSYITVGTGLNLINGDKHSTICAAINFREDEPYQNTIVAERFGEGENYQFAIIARSLYFTFWENNIEKSYHSNQATLLPNRWYHVCNTYNGAEVKHYMDGVIVGTHVATGNIDNHNANLLIGDIFNDSAQEFNGKIDDVRIYDAAMSDAEILDLYNNLNLPNGQETDRQALIALYNATNGANWNNNTNWNTAEPLNTWYGVTTNAEGRVITLELSENNLTGTIPTELGNLSQLSSLNLGTNFLSGSIPTSIGNLSQLVSISVYNNQLTGTIPAEFGNLTLLTGLGLNYNQLSGSIPAALANLTNLTALDLSANQLTGNIPADLGQLTNLLGLSLSGNQLTGNIPPELGNLVKVEEISLNVNQLNGTIPVEFGNLTSLARLYLHSNQLSGSIPQEVANLSNLVQFNFENNYIENIPVLASSVLLANESEGLNTASNYLTFASLEPNAANLQFTSKYAPQRQLPVSQSIVNAVLGQNLNLDFEAIVGRDLGGENNRYQWYKDGTAIGAQSTSPIYSIASVTDTDAGFYRCDITNTVLTGLTLITNDFELQIISGNPSELDSLALVDLYNATNGSSWTNNTNWLSGTLDTWYGIKLDANRRVESLILNENNLVGTIPASLGNLTSLKLLNLEKNSLSGTIPSTIGNLVNLTKLVFWSNNLSGSIPSELGSLANLHYLDMDENPFNQQLPDAIFNLTLLDTIYLGSCGFTGNIPSTISNLNSLKLLSFYNNSLTGSIPAELGNLTNLQKLYLGSNQLSGSIPAELGNLTNLQYLSLSGNQLSGSIPAELSNLTNLQTLVLSYNQLSGSIPAEIGNLISLKELYLHRNLLSGTIPIEVGSLTNLNSLSLSYNQLNGSIPAQIGNLSNINYISLSGNLLTGSIPSEIGNLSNLEQIYLRSNQLDGSIPAQLGNLSNLTNVWLQGNNFTDIPYFSSTKLLTSDTTGLFVNENYISFASLEPNASNLQYTSKYAPQKQIQLASTSAVVQAGSSLNLDITTLAGRDLGGSNNRYQWYKDGSAIGTQSTSPIYSIASVTATDAGFYRCDITNTVLTGLTLTTTNFELQVTGNSVEQDSLALVALYNATGGASWTNNTNWLKGPLSTWFGVTLDANKRVSLLELQSNNLVGTLPSEIGNLSELLNLRLFSNSLTGNIPTQIGNLTKLTFIEMGSNQFNSALPSQIGNLTNLQTLYIANANLIGSIPTTIGNLVNLTQLALDKNQLSGSIPMELSQLINIQELYLHENQLIGNVPSEIGNLSNLKTIYLQNNELETVPTFISTVLVGSEFQGLRFQNNYFTFASLEPNATNFQYTSKYSPQKQIPLLNTGSTQPAGSSLNLDIAAIVGRSLGGSNNHYQWYKDDSPVGTDSPVLSFTNLSSADAGKYYCVITNSILTGLSLTTDAYTLTVGSSAVSLTTLSPSALSGTAATIPVNVVTNVSTDVTLYYRKSGGSNIATNAQNTSGNTTLNFNLTGLSPNTTYYCYALTQNSVQSNEISFTTTGGCSGTSVDITGTDLEICRGLSLAYYTVSNTQYSSINWMPTNGQVLAGQNQNVVTVKWDENQSNYAINMQFTDLNGCTQSVNKPITIKGNSSLDPNLKAKKKRNYILIAHDTPTGAQYKWFHNGVLVSGATKQYYIVPQDQRTGKYTVEITTSDGCSNKSNIISFNKNGEIEGFIPEEFEKESMVFPNPATDHATLLIKTEITGVAHIEICDMSGRTLKRMEFNKENFELTTNVPLQDISKGVYLIKLNIGTEFSAFHQLIIK